MSVESVRVFSIEHRRNLSLSLRGRKLSEEHKKKLVIAFSGEGNGMYGKRHSEKTKKNMSIANTGRVSGMKGKQHTEETKNKLRTARTGTKLTEETKKKIGQSSKGHSSHTEYQLRRIRESNSNRVWKESSKQKIRKSREEYIGSNHPNWRGGVSCEPYDALFTTNLKKRIRNRDNYTCQLCGILEHGERLSVHHIDYDKKNSTTENLASLCRPCHTKTGFNRDMWETKFNNIVQAGGV